MQRRTRHSKRVDFNLENWEATSWEYVFEKVVNHSPLGDAGGVSRSRILLKDKDLLLLVSSFMPSCTEVCVLQMSRITHFIEYVPFCSENTQLLKSVQSDICKKGLIIRNCFTRQWLQDLTDVKCERRPYSPIVEVSVTHDERGEKGIISALTYTASIAVSQR